MLTIDYLKEASVGDVMKGPSGFRFDGADMEYEIVSVEDTDKQRHIIIKGRLFGVDFIKTDAFIKSGDKLVMHSVIL